MNRTRAIKEFLMRKAEPDLAALYSHDMEVQVNVTPGEVPITGTTEAGHTWRGWRGPSGELYKHYRIPFPNGTYEDKAQFFDLGTHAEAIGMTGWDWAKRASLYVGYDIDSLIGHKKGLSDQELATIQERACAVDWVTVRRSKGGKGLHLYVFFSSPIPTVSREEHTALARALLGRLVAATGLDLRAQVDKFGCNLWVWHKSTKPGGLSLIKQGKPYTDVPPDWREHVEVVQGKRSRPRIRAPKPDQPLTAQEEMEDLVGRQSQVPLDDGHRKLLGWFATSGLTWWWDQDRHLLVCHTAGLKRAHTELGLKGFFHTISSGTDPGDQNCFAFPARNGSWIVRRHGPGCLEHAAWVRDAQGWTKCTLNQAAELKGAAAAHSGVENKGGEFVFPSMLKAKAVLQDLAAHPLPEIPDWISLRSARLSEHGPGRVFLACDRQPSDVPIPGWLSNKKGVQWEVIVNIATAQRDPAPPDELVRAVVQNQEDNGFFLRTTEDWVTTAKSNVISALVATGVGRGEIEHTLGQAVLNPWRLVSVPFQDEYPGDRRWNIKAAKLAVLPKPGPTPAWDYLFAHVGKNLDEHVLKDPWCKRHGLTSGGDYFRHWFANLLQRPLMPLPYLYLWGPFKSGKSILHEQFGRCLSRGYVNAASALLSEHRFNGELVGAVFCYVEEINVRENKQAYDRIKDWVTAKNLSIHPKGGTPYEVPNGTHWIQVANPPDYCPMAVGDTRITMCWVGEQEDPVTKPEMEERLWAEAPMLIWALKHLELPPAPDRLMLPVLQTEDKKVLEEATKSELDRFMEEQVVEVPGVAIKASVFYEAFMVSLDVERRRFWTQNRVGRELTRRVVRGRYKNGGYQYYGNITLKSDHLPPPGVPLVAVDGNLRSL